MTLVQVEALPGGTFPPRTKAFVLGQHDFQWQNGSSTIRQLSFRINVHFLLPAYVVVARLIMVYSYTVPVRGSSALKGILKRVDRGDISYQTICGCSHSLTRRGIEVSVAEKLSWQCEPESDDEVQHVDEAISLVDADAYSSSAFDATNAASCGFTPMPMETKEKEFLTSPFVKAIHSFVPDSPEAMPGSEAFLDYLNKMMSLTEIGDNGNVDEFLSTQTRQPLTSSFYNSSGHSKEHSPASTPKNSEQLLKKYAIDPVLLQSMFQSWRGSADISSSGQCEEQTSDWMDRSSTRGFLAAPLNQIETGCPSGEPTDWSCLSKALFLRNQTHTMGACRPGNETTQMQQREYSTSSCYSEDRQKTQDNSSKNRHLEVSSPYAVT